MPTDFHIVLIDDSVADTLIIQRAFREGEVEHRLTSFADGRAALDYLLRLEYKAGPDCDDPDLILLDLNLPGLDGGQVLATIKGDPYLKSIPVVVLTTSSRQEDVSQSYLAGANTFIRKPDEYPRYRELVTLLRLYWADTAQRRTRRP